MAKEVIDAAVVEFKTQAVDGQRVNVHLREEPVKGHCQVPAQAVTGYVEVRRRFFDQAAAKS